MFLKTQIVKQQPLQCEKSEFFFVCYTGVKKCGAVPCSFTI